MGEASNPGPNSGEAPPPLGPGRVDWSRYDAFAPGYAGWIFLTHPVWDDGRRSFHASPSGGGPRRKFTVAANWGLFDGLDPEGSYLAHGVRAHGGPGPAGGFLIGATESEPGIVRVWCLEGGGGWVTRKPGSGEGGEAWAHADLACGIGGFTVAAGAIRGTRQWACDLDPEVAGAFNAAHGQDGGALAAASPLEDRRRWHEIAGADIITAGFPCQAFSTAGAGRGFEDARGTVVFHLVEMCSVLRPPFMVLECVWEFFARPRWVGPTLRAFAGLGYGVVVRCEQAGRYLPQERLRGLLIAVRSDWWGRAGGEASALFAGASPRRVATVGSTDMVGPDPPAGSHLYLSERDALLYSPGAYLRRSWPWEGYRRVPGPDQQVPTVMRSYGHAAMYAGTQGGAHGFFRRVPGVGYRFFSPAELAVAQGFPAGTTLPTDYRAAWQLLGNAIPPPMALLGLLGPVALLTNRDRLGRQAAVDWARGAFGRLLLLAQGNWGGPVDGTQWAGHSEERQGPVSATQLFTPPDPVGPQGGTPTGRGLDISPVPGGAAGGARLVILDMNGVLIHRAGRGAGGAQVRPHIEGLWRLFEDSRGQLVPAIWSSMARHNLWPLVLRALGEERAERLAFCWGQECCTPQHRGEGLRPVLRKDLSKLEGTPWGVYLPDSVLLVDDDPLKCSANEQGTAVCPKTFRGTGGLTAARDDGELLKLAGYIRALSSNAGGVRSFVRSNPYHGWTEEPAGTDGPPVDEDSPGEQLRRAAAAFGWRPTGRSGGAPTETAEGPHSPLGVDTAPAGAGPAELFRGGGDGQPGEPQPEEVWIEPPDEAEADILLQLLPVLRGGGMPDLRARADPERRVRVRGFHQPSGEPRPFPVRPRSPGTGQAGLVDRAAEPGRPRSRSRTPRPATGWHPLGLAAAAMAIAAARRTGAEAAWTGWIPDHRGGSGPREGEWGARWGYRRPVHQVRGGFDSTRGYPGEGPIERSRRGESITVATVNVTSWNGGVAQGALDLQADVLMLQETRLTEDAQRASRAEARRAQYWGAVDAGPPAVQPGGGLRGASHAHPRRAAVEESSPGRAPPPLSEWAVVTCGCLCRGHGDPRFQRLRMANGLSGPGRQAIGPLGGGLRGHRRAR